MQSVLDQLKPAFGGIATFCEDPDGLLEDPALREILREENLTLHDWDGHPDRLPPLDDLAPQDRPLIVVHEPTLRHVVEERFPSHRWEEIGIGHLFPRLSYEVVKDIPPARWDDLTALQEHVERGAWAPLSARQTAELVARGLYGVDPLYLQLGGGWSRLLADLTTTSDGLPRPVARLLVEVAPVWVKSAAGPQLEAMFSDPVVAHAEATRILKQHADKVDAAGPAVQLLYRHARRKARASDPWRWSKEAVRETDLVLERRLDPSVSAEAILDFALKYVEAIAAGILPEKEQVRADRMFETWLRTGYHLVLSSQNHAVRRLPKLLDYLDREVGDGRSLLLVIDGLGLRAWREVEVQWLEDKVMGSADTRAAFAVLPTITSFGRRALFEGKIPSQFSGAPHSARLERAAWQARYGSEGVCAEASEIALFEDGLALGRKRMAALDVSWDRRGHSLDPRFESVEEVARVWAARSGTSMLAKRALDAGYRVFVTSDHGQVSATGAGRLPVGELPDERSKRVILFGDAPMRDGFASREDSKAVGFTPAGLPEGCHPLFARDHLAFDIQGMQSVSHGGLSLEEVIVPFVELSRE
jgi:hypothetical protein